MPSNINSQMTDTSNTIAARPFINRRRGNVGFIEAPQHLPKYSISEKLEEKDIFRKNVLQTSYQKKERKNFFKKFLTIAGVVVATVLGCKFLSKKV